MIVEMENVERIKEELDNRKIQLRTTANEYGIEFLYLWLNGLYTAFVPWGYELEINNEGYPEIHKPRSGSDWF